MTRPLLLLRLEGPLQAWGLRARWDVRDTGDEPSKSGVVGLLGCALGYPVYDRRLEELDEAITLGVRTEHTGQQITDFQTITGTIRQAGGTVRGSPEAPATIISPRTYLQDAAFLVVIAGPEKTLEACRDALAAPRWPVFLGRKSCPPTRPVLEGLTRDYEGVEEALRREPWDWEGRDVLRAPPQELRCVMEDEQGEAVRPDRIRVNPPRMYGSRRVKVFWTTLPNERRAGPCTSPA